MTDIQSQFQHLSRQRFELDSAELASAQYAAASPGYADAPGSADVSSAHKGWHSRGYHPHFDAQHTFQFITFRLHDSVPTALIQQWKEELNCTERLAPNSKEAIALRQRVETYADRGVGACYLRDARIAQLVQNSLKYLDGKRYRLIAWCVMPNHVHVLIQMMDHSLSNIVRSWKSYTAHQANKLLGRTGRFWMPDYFDRFVRNERHFAATVEYIRQNPVKAGLVDTPEEWPWSGQVELEGG